MRRRITRTIPTFADILCCVLEVTIDEVSEACGQTDDDCAAEFSFNAVGLFTHRGLLLELRKLLEAHQFLTIVDADGLSFPVVISCIGKSDRVS